MNDLCHVYILRSESRPDTFYTGFTENMATRLADHNAGRDPHTAKFRPWSIKTVVSFADRQQALEFERYLKTASGRAFSKKTALKRLSSVFAQSASLRYVRCRV